MLDLLPGLDLRGEDGGISVAAAPVGGLSFSLGHIGPDRRRSTSGIPHGSRPCRPRVATRPAGNQRPRGAARWGLAGGARLRSSPYRAPGRAGRAPGALALEGRSGEATWGEWKVTWRPETAPCAAGAGEPDRLVQRRGPGAARLGAGRQAPSPRRRGPTAGGPLLPGGTGPSTEPGGVAGARREWTSSSGSRGSAGRTPSFHPLERRRSVSMLSTPEVLRRTGGKPVKSIIYDEATIAARVGRAGRGDHRRRTPTASSSFWGCSRAASSS